MIESAILLAAGESRRMGQDKATLDFGGQSLVHRLVERLTAVVSDVVIVVREPEAWSLPGVRLVTDRHSGRGPLEGLAVGLAAVRSERAILVACDMPFLSAATLRRLAGEPDDADVVVPRGPRGREPLCALYARRLLPGLDAYLHQGERRVLSFLDTVSVREVSFEDLGVATDAADFWNLNRPDEYQRALARLRAEPPTEGRPRQGADD